VNRRQSSALFRAALTGALYPRNRALYTARLAAAILAQGHVDEAAGVGSAVLTALEDGISSVQVLEALRPVYDAVKAVRTDEKDSGSSRGEPGPDETAAGQGRPQDPAGLLKNEPPADTGTRAAPGYGTRAGRRPPAGA